MTELREMLFAAFQAEHKEHLEGIRAILSKMEQDGGAASSADLDEVFRHAHTLKAAARVCDFQTIESMGQRLETLFSQMRKGTVRAGKEVLEAVRAALIAIEDWALRLTEKESPPEPVHALQALDRVLAGGPPAASRPAQVDELGAELLAAFQIEHKEHLEGIRAILGEIETGAAPTSDRVDEAFRRAHSLKGAARLADLRPAEALAHRLETLFARVREGTLRLDGEVTRVIGMGLDAIEDWAASLTGKKAPPEPVRVLEAISRILEGRPGEQAAAEEPAAKEPASAEPAASLSPTSQAAETVRVSAENLDRLLRSAGQLLTETMRQNVVARELAALSRQLDGLAKEGELVRNAAGAALRQLAATPGLAQVARYLALAEQQVRSLSRQARTVRRLHQRSAWTLGLLGGELQQDVRRVRMVSAESVFRGFRKMMRGLARDEGKEIDFRVSGFEIEADRMVLQALKDPLMHILCNAVSHGLETPEERRRQGKNPVGRVALHLESPGNRLMIRVEDDGRGIDFAKVTQVAVQRGILSEAEAHAASPEELGVILFKPGFSTSRMVTDLSGRGMGLSVVSEAAARLQGEVQLRPRQPSGTVLLLSVPLMVSTQRLLLVSCRGQTFALPLHGIEGLLRVKFDEVEMVEGKPMLLLQRQPIPVLSLAALLDMSQPEAPLAGGSLPLILLHLGGRQVAVAVDAFVEERHGLIKDLDEPAVRISKLIGGILLEDGSVCLVLNLAEVIRTSKTSEQAPAWRKAETAPLRKRSTVLVVDDSLTTRTLEKSILETHGYNVRIAMDGVEALARLQEETFDLVITDVRMPRMDGFQLLEEMKKDKRLAQVPVIVVTSMGRREDQEKGLALGADAYIVKRKFDHEELLNTIQQIIF